LALSPALPPPIEALGEAAFILKGGGLGGELAIQ